MLKNFRLISILEGISFLVILFVTMPLKYGLDILEPNMIVGSLHGLLFIAYIIMAFFVKGILNWNIKTFLIVLACSIIPFGTFWMKKKYLDATPFPVAEQ